MKNFFLFDSETYDQWIVSRHKNNPIKTRFAFAQESQTGPLSVSDSELFRCFDSLSRLDRQNPTKLNFKHGKYEPVIHRYLKVSNLEIEDKNSIRTWDAEPTAEEDSGKMDEPSPLKDASEEDKLSSESEHQLGVGLFSNIPLKVKATKKAPAAKAEDTPPSHEWEECTILISSGNYAKKIPSWDKSWAVRFVQMCRQLPVTSKDGVFRFAEKLNKLQQRINSHGSQPKNPKPRPRATEIPQDLHECLSRSKPVCRP